MNASTGEQLISLVRAEFKNQFENEPEYVTLTPGRINIIGEHTDYNEGLAMPSAIDRWICAAICSSSSESSTILSLNYNEIILIDSHISGNFLEIWKQLATTTIHVITSKFGIEEGVNMVLYGNIPIGCGLSSSSSFVISIVQTILQLFSIHMEARQIARLCQKIENRALGTSGGLLDQYAIILSRKDHFMIIDFKIDSVEYISAIINECSWIVINSHIQRELSESDYLNRVNECNKGLAILKEKCNISSIREIDQSMLEELKKEYNVLFKRLCHVVDENQRVHDMKDLLKKGAAEKVGIILKESHKSLKSLYEVSCKEINSIIEMSEEVDGWYGGRIMGGGFGGCSIHLVAYERVNEFTDHIMESYKGKFHIVPEIMKVTFPGALEQL